MISEGQDAAMDLGMEALHATIHHFWKSRELRNIFDCDTVLSQKRRSAAGRDNLNPQLRQSTGKFDNPFLVGDTDQGPLNLGHGFLFLLLTVINARDPRADRSENFVRDRLRPEGHLVCGELLSSLVTQENYFISLPYSPYIGNIYHSQIHAHPAHDRRPFSPHQHSPAVRQ